MKLKLTLLALMAITCFSVQAQNDGLYKVVYEANQQGEKVSGNLDELLSYVRNGNPIRVGWQLGRKSDSTFYLEHWSDAGFITIHKDHVFAQIRSIYGQGSTHFSMPVPALFLTNNNSHGWVAIIGTTGEVKQKFERNEEMVKYLKDTGLTDEEVEAELKKQEKSRYATKWAVMVKD